MTELRTPSGVTVVGEALITVVGEALIDLVPTGELGGFQARPGGSPYNVAIGLARLGNTTSLMARLGENAFGRLLRAHAKAEGVSLKAAPRALEPTTLAVVSVDEADQASYDFYLRGTADWQWTAAELQQIPTETELLHFGSVASWTNPGADRIHQLVAELHHRGDVLVSYDPNVRPQLLGEPPHGRRLVERSVAVAHVVKASREDVEWLYPGMAIAAVGARWIEIGAAVVVITDGGAGAAAFTAGGLRLHRPGRRVEVVDTVGAGDSFSSGLLDGLLRRELTTPGQLPAVSERALLDVLDEAILVSAITCERAGADPPTAAELIGRAHHAGGISGEHD
jgi:fructokinase